MIPVAILGHVERRCMSSVVFSLISGRDRLNHEVADGICEYIQLETTGISPWKFSVHALKEAALLSDTAKPHLHASGNKPGITEIPALPERKKRSARVHVVRDNRVLKCNRRD